MSNPIITFGLRGAQILFSVVALGLSVSLLKGHKYGDLPATIGFSIFVTAVALLGAFVGIAANWVELLQGIIGAGIDGLVLLANIAGGILIAYKMRGTNCSKTDDDSRYKLNGIEIINGGFFDKFTDGTKMSVWWYVDQKKLNSYCREAQADSAFMFLTVIVLIAAITITLLHNKR